MITVLNKVKTLHLMICYILYLVMIILTGPHTKSFPKKIDATLEDLGAERFFWDGQGNSDRDIDSHFQEWSAHFWVRCLEYYGLGTSVLPILLFLLYLSSMDLISRSN